MRSSWPGMGEKIAIGSPQASASRGRQPARFADEKIADLHQLVHPIGVAEDAEAPAIARRPPASTRAFTSSLFPQITIVCTSCRRCFSRSHDQLRRPDAERARGEQQRGLLRVQARSARAPPARSTGSAKIGIDRDAGDRDALRRQAERFEVRLGFVDRDEVAVKHPREPHRVAVEVRDDDREMRAAARPVSMQMRDDPRRHEVRADGDVRIEFADELHQLAACSAGRVACAPPRPSTAHRSP